MFIESLLSNTFYVGINIFLHQFSTYACYSLSAVKISPLNSARFSMGADEAMRAEQFSGATKM